MSASLPPQAVVFDLDGLMFNTEELYQEVGGKVLRRRGKQFTPELLDAMMGRPANAALKLMIDWHQLSDSIEQLSTETEEIFETLLDDRLDVMPGLLPLLARLEQAAIPKAIATSSGPAFVHRVLGQFDLAPRFRFVLTSADIVQGKPHPEIYQLAARKFELETNRLLVLEDSQNGCRAAIAAGTIAVAVPAGHSRRHDFSGASLVVESLADPRLLSLLGVS